MTTSQLEEELARQLRLAGVETPQREFVFRYPRKFRFDFAYPDKMLAIEVEGGVWSQGRHTRGSGFVKDIEKYNLAALDGWAVLRVTGDMIESGEALTLIEKALCNQR
jgi:very-short-patch-repair endonuclease